MHGLGTIVNVIAIIIGGIIGIVLKKGIPEKFKTTIMQAIGLAVIVEFRNSTGRIYGNRARKA